ncbi:hypothetical protein CMK12_15320 [Candidatus Poribacteria bacterium]|nr:hypothetical protein [Candidatus Poribacteria bacterium]
MRKFLLNVLLILLINISFGQDKFNGNRSLLTVLNANSEWRSLETTNDSIHISVKELDGSELQAVKVEKTLDVEPNLVTDVIMDVESYNSFLSDAESLKSRVIERSDTGLVGYQRIKVDLPFFDDREYFFKMNRTPFGDQDATTMCYWILLDPDDKAIARARTKDVTYLKKGAGIWKWEPSESGRVKIAYMLYMPPGGSIPDFLIDMINKRSIVGLFRDVGKEVNARNTCMGQSL